MSQIPRPARCGSAGSSCPVVKTTSKTVERNPATNEVTTTISTTTRRTIPTPRSTAALARASTSGAPVFAKSARPTIPKPTGAIPKATRVLPTSTPRVPSAAGAPRALRPTTSRPVTAPASQSLVPPQSRTAGVCRSQGPCASSTPAWKSTPAGQYLLPAEFGRKTLQGKSLKYSSPQPLRVQLEDKLSKELKFYSNAPPYGTGMPRSALAKHPAWEDFYAGSFSIYDKDEEYQRDFDSSIFNTALGPEDIQKTLDELPPDEEHEADASQQLMMRSYSSPDTKVSARAAKISTIPAPVVTTQKGTNEMVLQQARIEKILEKSHQGEKISQHLVAVDTDERTGMAKKVELDVQQFDPNYAIGPSEPLDTVKITSEVSITASEQTLSKHVSHEVIGAEGGVSGVGLSPQQLERLVQEEKEDVEETLKIVPADMELTPGKYPLKKRLQNLRLNSETMGLLEQSIVYNAPNADEAQADAPPEMLASIMHTVENGVVPQAPPNQIFNTLFTEANNSQFITLKSVSPGPLQDVVVPIEIPSEVHSEMLSSEVQQLAEQMQTTNAEKLPREDIFTRVLKRLEKRKGKKTKAYKGLSGENAPWGEENIEEMVNLVGAEPTEALASFDIEELENNAAQLEAEMTNGIEYFVEADPLQYMSRVQLRGSLPPSWFPGYLVALPEYKDVVKIAKSPSQVLFQAWKAVQPKYFPDDTNPQSFVY